MDAERLLLSKIAQTGRIQKLLLAGIRDEHFSSEENQEIFTFISSHTRRWRQPPSFNTIKEEFPNHNFEIVDESTDYLLDEFLKEIKRRYSITYIRELVNIIDENDKEEINNIDATFLEKSRQLAQIIPASQIHRFSEMDKRIEQYELEQGEQRGIQTGIPSFDSLTLGIQPHEYITIMGFSGRGKSTLAQWMLYNAWAQAKTPMIISLEMEANALLRKWDTMATHFEYHNLKAHKLREDEMDRWKKKAEQIKQLPNDIIVQDDVRYCTVDRVYADLVKWRPDICCIDYISLMDTRGAGGTQMWEKVANITHDLKQIARTLKIPIIGIAQTNRNSADTAAELEHVGYSIGIIQDSDLVFGLHQDQEMKEESQMQVRLLKNRDGALGSAELLWKMDTMTFEPWKESMMYQNRLERSQNAV